jgi:peptidoglycan hydrolase-like protein with peptidoglycan-binding domain
VSRPGTFAGRFRDRRWIATRLGIPAAALAVGIPLGIAATGGSEASAADGGGSTATAPVTRRDLVDRETFSGTLGYGDARNVVGGLQGTITSAADEGSVRERGEVLYRVDERPVVLMYGATPAYRAMGQGDEGADVRQLERNLVALGFDPDRDIDVDGDFDWATAAAVRDWQEALGVDETGRIDLGQVVFLGGPRRIGVVQGTVGSSARPGQPVMQTSSTARTVTVALDARRQDLVAEGDAERVTLPGGDVATATVTEVGKVAKAASAGADPTIAVTLQLRTTKGVTALDEAPVDVAISTDRAKDALSVPVTALLALDGGGYGLEVVEPGGGTRIASVAVGLFADGFVQVSGAGIAEGAEVVVPA